MTIDHERGPGDRSALSRCIRVGTDEFGASYWGRQPLLSRAVDLAQDFGDLFDAAAVDELIAERGLRTPFIRMANEGSVLPAASFTGSGGYGAEVGDQVDSAKVLAEFAAGSTIVLQGLHRTWAPLGDFIRQLVTDVGHPCQVNAYVTPASSRGFDPHYDVHDVFVVQIAGEKQWRIHEPVHPDPLRDQPWTEHRDAVAHRSAESPAIDETLRPGDVLYLPRGWIHSATALGGTSIHLTIGMAALTRFDVVQELVRSLATDPSLRASLPLGAGFADAHELAPTIRETIEDAAARLRGDDDGIAADVAGRLTRRVRDSSRPEAVRPLATVEAMSDRSAPGIRPISVQLRYGLTPIVSRDATTVSVILPGKTVTLPAEAAEAVTALASGEAAAADALAGLDPESSGVVSRRLLREGILVVR